MVKLQEELDIDVLVHGEPEVRMNQLKSAFKYMTNLLVTNVI